MTQSGTVAQPGTQQTDEQALLARLKRPDSIAMIVLTIGALAGFFHAWLFRQHRLSMDAPSDWGHAYLVPLISIYLVWMKRDELARSKATRFWPALPVILFGVISYVFFTIGGYSNHMAQGISMVLTVFGVVLLLLGPNVMRVMFLPIAYLVFTITISQKIMILLTFRLQMIAAQGSWILLNMLGITTERRGNTLDVMKSDGTMVPLNIAEACSGMRMLVAFVALGAAVALVGCKYWWQRVILIAMAGPVAILLNVLRVAILGIASLFDTNLAEGEAHTLIGTLLLIPGFGMYMLIVWILNKSVQEAPATAKAKKRPQPVAARPVAPLRLWNPAFIAVIVLLVGSAASLGAVIKMFNFHLRKLPIEGIRQIRAASDELPNWVHVGPDRYEKPEIQKTLGTENYVTRTYRERVSGPDQEPRMMDVHLAYYTGMIDTVPHVPERCMTGAGWQIMSDASLVSLPLNLEQWRVDPFLPEELKNRKIRTARLPSDPKFTDMPGMQVRLPEGIDDARMRVSEFADPVSGHRVYIGYFFIANGALTPTAEGVRSKAFDLKMDYAYYAKVQLTSRQAQTIEAFGAESASLLNDLFPEIMLCLPDWVEVERGRYPPGRERPASKN